MHIKLSTIRPQTLTTTVTIGKQQQTASLTEHQPVKSGYLLILDLHDSTPPLQLLEEITDGERQSVQYYPPGRA